MATPKLRDRDAIVTGEGLVFRVFGYSHPPDAYVCDAEYASATIFKSDNPKAFRNRGQQVFYKFYEDEGWKFVEKGYPQYMIPHEMLQKRVVGVNHRDISKVRKPEKELRKLIQTEPKDSLHAATRKVLDIAVDRSGLQIESFGVFGSMLHGFYHPRFSDIDLIVYGGENVAKLRKTLQELYEAKSSILRNEFETEESIRGKVWRLRNFTPQEFLWHQRRKLIYSLFDSKESGRTIKTEFEPVKNWKEIRNEYNSATRILQRGWVRMIALVRDDGDAPFIPSVYHIEPLKILEGGRQAQRVRRIISYMEEFRMQAFRDETVYVEGNLEEVTGEKDDFFQIALTYCPRYYEQVLKKAAI
ncbi:MAG TPA: nucleotidyltransferase domain-containing protein [candidate division Zixibacteria bacterium]|nr:nucleotidyltransferase domain-containing protein [candidate division Zixibacteria bacterium]